MMPPFAVVLVVGDAPRADADSSVALEAEIMIL